MPEPLLPSPLACAELLELGLGGGESVPELTCGVGVAAGVDGVSRAGLEAASASASEMDPGLVAGVEGGFEKGGLPPAPGSVERRGGGGRRVSGGGNPGKLGLGAPLADGELGSLGPCGPPAGELVSGAVAAKFGSADGIRPPHSTQNTAPSDPSAPQWGHRAERPAMVTAFLPSTSRGAARKFADTGNGQGNG